jgi:hypothetical protein
MSDPTQNLCPGARILETELRPLGFEFIFRAAGKGSGGPFAAGDFGTSSAAHAAYLRGLGFRDECRYPGFSDDPLVAFHDLADDLKFAADFTTGNAAVLLRAAVSEAQVLLVGRPALP